MITSRELHSSTATGTRGPKVKICGITTPEHALAAARSGADMLGMVFAPSRRQVSVEQAKAIRAALEPLGNRPVLVGVFVNETNARVMQTAREVGLDIVQLSGDETPQEAAACARYFPVIKALRFPAGTAIQHALETCREYKMLATDISDRDELEREPHGPSKKLYFLVDAFCAGKYGGTGQLADWSLAAALSAREEILLAGGLNPQNVAGALAAAAPWGVDVSSGVESDGVKDAVLIESFIRAARSLQER